MNDAHKIDNIFGDRSKHMRFHFRISFDTDEIGRKIKWAWQRLTRGYSDCDLWGLGNVVCRFVHPRLKAFIKMNVHSYPAGLKSMDEWKSILKEMEWAIDTLIKDDIKYNSENNKRLDKALKLCGEYIFTMWD